MPKRISLCSDPTTDRTRFALCQLSLDGGAPPDWVQLVPRGEKVQALDGRSFKNTAPQAIVDTFNADPRDIPVDWEHASELKAPKGEPAPAAGWLKALEVRNGTEIWGQVEWTPRGAESLRTKEYRYLSPAFIHDKAKKIVELISAALTNRPALDLPALAHSTPAEPAKLEEDMDPKLLALLGLKEDATPEQVLEAVTELKKKGEDPIAELEAAQTELAETKDELATARTELTNARNANPALDKFVPRADFDAATARAKTAEAKVAEIEANARKTEVDAEIKSALEAGKITPATEGYYREQCMQDGGLEKFKAFCADAPVIAPDTDLDKKKPPKSDTDNSKVTDEQREIYRRCGLTEEQFLTGQVQS